MKETPNLRIATTSTLAVQCTNTPRELKILWRLWHNSCEEKERWAFKNIWAESSKWNTLRGGSGMIQMVRTTSNDWTLPDTYIFHIILTTILQDQYYCTLFTDRAMVAKRSQWLLQGYKVNEEVRSCIWSHLAPRLVNLMHVTCVRAWAISEHDRCGR